MLLFKSITEIKKYGNVNKNTDFLSLTPYILAAQQKYILPVLGETQMDEVLTAYHGSSSPPPYMQRLIDRIQPALANYALFEAVPQNMVMFSDLGLQEENDKERTSSPARQWVVHELRQALADTGDLYTDALLSYMELNKTDFPLWVSSAEYSQTRDIFLNAASAFNVYQKIGNSRRTYLALRPFIKEAEEEFIRPILGDALYAQMKQTLQNSSPFTPPQLALLDKIGRVLANRTLWKALPVLRLYITADGITTKTYMEGIKNHKELTETQFAVALSSYENTAKTFEQELRKYLYDNAALFPLYQKPVSINTISECSYYAKGNFMP